MRYMKTCARQIVGIVTLLLLLNPLTHTTWAESNPAVLAKVEVVGMVDQLGVPVYAHLQDANGFDYALVVSTKNQMDSLNLKYRILAVIKADTKASDFVVALERISGARILATNTVTVLFDDGKHIIAKADEAQTETLAAMGFEINRLPEDPMVFKVYRKLAVEEALAVDYDPNVQAMINSISQSTLHTYTGNLSGEWAVNIGGADYTISSRHTNSGTSIQKATQYVYEFLQGLGLSTSYHNWTYGSYSNRNVVGEKAGTVSPTEIILVTAHLDSMPSGSFSPGADDNASGSVGVMALAEAMNSYDFERTVRFVLFTGEEQGLYGSKRYASAVSSENIVAVYNMDMIAWDSTGGPTLRIHTRTSSNPGYSADMELANTFTDVVSTYGMSSNLTPIIDSDGVSASDHASFWNEGFAAILAIEDDVNDFCDYYHTTNDRLSTLNMDYFTNYVKASLGTVAHLAFLPTSGPRANFSYSINDLAVSFTDTSTNSTGTNTSWYWEFGDGATSTVQNPNHTYSAYGNYDVSLTVTDDSSLTDTKTSSITLEEPKGNCGVAPVKSDGNQLALVSESLYRAFIPLLLAILTIAIAAYARRKRQE